jgi:hypothetical protein
VIGKAGAWVPSYRGFGIAKILKKRQLNPRQGCHPMDVGSMDLQIVENHEGVQMKTSGSSRSEAGIGNTVGHLEKYPLMV